jgi:molecular chaperone Hsp33
MADGLIRGVIRDRLEQAGGSWAGARIVAAVTTAVVTEAVRRHAALPAATVALGRATTAGLLFATLSKSEDERVSLQILGDGPLGSVTVDADGGGKVRGFVKRPGASVLGPTRSRFSLARGVGSGTVQVIRDLGLRDQYRGSTPLVSGEIDEDLETYLQNSEQIESALSCDVVLYADGGVAASGGVLVQCLPNGDVETVVRVRERLRAGAVYQALASGGIDARGLARAVLGELDVAVDIQVDQPVTFHCACSRDRVGAALALCGEAELRSMMEKDGGAEVTCNFCGERYRLADDELRRLIHGIVRA